MASIHKDIPIDAHPDAVWAAVRDFGALDRLAPGFVRDVRLEGDAPQSTRIVTFANGMVAREVLVDCDDTRRRLVYAVISERVTHYSASVQVAADGHMVLSPAAARRLIAASADSHQARDQARQLAAALLNAAAHADGGPQARD